MAQKNEMVVNLFFNEHCYTANYNDINKGVCGNVIGDVDGEVRYVDFPELVESIVSLPIKFYEPGVNVIFNQSLSSSRVEIQEPKKKAIKTLVDKLSEYAKGMTKFPE